MKSPFLIPAETKQSQPSHSTLALSDRIPRPAVPPLAKQDCDINLYEVARSALYSMDLLTDFHFS